MIDVFSALFLWFFLLSLLGVSLLAGAALRRFVGFGLLMLVSGAGLGILKLMLFFYFEWWVIRYQAEGL